MDAILFTTCDKWPNLFESDELVVAALQVLGHKVQTARWQGEFEAFQRADLIISRAHWDYHYDMAGFTGWLDRLEAEALPVYNPVALIRWNLEKRYLLDLKTQGVAIPVTEVLSPSDDLHVIYDKQGWDCAVIKPMAGASGYLVERVGRGELADWQAVVRPRRPNQEWLVQEFLPEIEQGELSLIFIEGEFSHAVRKRPQTGDFRTNLHYRGHHSREWPTDRLVAQAQTVLQALPSMPLYARVDGVVRGADQFCLIELEINEPELYFHHAPEQAQMLAKAIQAKQSG